MQASLQIDTGGIPMPAHLREIVDGHIKKLEDRFGRLTALRLAVRAPGAHHRMGEPLAVSIRLTLPGRREVNVQPVSNDLDPRHSDITFAVNDAFRRATIQLQRHADDLKNRPKESRGTEIGRISSLDPEKNCGFLSTSDDREIYFHAHSVLDGKFGKLAVGAKVAYHEEPGLEGPQASTVRLLNRGHHG